MSARPLPAGPLPPLVEEIVQAALGRKAEAVVILDLRNTAAFTDYFVIASGRSTRQVRAIAEAVEATVKAASVRPNHLEGLDRGEWVLIDCFDVVVHLFTPEMRAFYDLERLWGSARRIERP